jgi:hypothetical protein
MSKEIDDMLNRLRFSNKIKTNQYVWKIKI